MKTLWCKNQENPSDRISHAWAPLMFNSSIITEKIKLITEIQGGGKHSGQHTLGKKLEGF